MTKHIILFLAANPLGTDRCALDAEARAIEMELERSGHRDRFELVTRWAAQPLDLLRELRKFRPTVVHYAGHSGIDGLYFEAPMGMGVEVVSPAALQETFDAVGRSVRVVVLNGCYSDVHADALLMHADCVVGTDGAIRDDAATRFAIGFYGGLGAGESAAFANATKLAPYVESSVGEFMIGPAVPE